MELNLTLPGFGGGGSRKPAKVEPKPIVKRRYWTPDPNDETLYKGEPGYQGYGPRTEGGTYVGGSQLMGAGDGMVGGTKTYGPPGYDPNDAFYKDKVWDKKTQKWIKSSDDIYRTNDDGDILMWEPPRTPQKRGLLK